MNSVSFHPPVYPLNCGDPWGSMDAPRSLTFFHRAPEKDVFSDCRGVVEVHGMPQCMNFAVGS